MKTIVFFHRLDLTDLYLDLSRALAGQLNVVHLAYSDAEYRRLEAAGVNGPIVHFKDAVRSILETVNDPDPTTLKEIDEAILEQTGGAFNLNGVIQSDRGFVLLKNDECLRLSVAYYRFWDAFVCRYKVDYLLHETPSLLFNFLSAIVLGRHGGRYLYNIMVPSEPGAFDYLSMHGFDFTCADLDRAMAQIERGEIPIDEARCAAFLREYRNDLSVFLGSSISRNVNPARMLLGTVRNRLAHWLRRDKHDRLVDNIEYWDRRRNVAEKKLINTLNYKHRVKFDDFDPVAPYYFYGFQLEPEAGVHYQGHGIYMNQVKLIQNIAAQLPPGSILYVKDHPHDYGYRPAIDYIRLAQVPNIRLLPSHIPAKKIIFGSQGVMTITGTAGFEAILMGKSVFAFGKTYYSACPQVTYIENIRDLRQAVYAKQGRIYEDRETLYPYLMAFLIAKREGLIDYYGGRATKYGVDLAGNAQKIAQMLLEKASA